MDRENKHTNQHVAISQTSYNSFPSEVSWTITQTNGNETQTVLSGGSPYTAVPIGNGGLACGATAGPTPAPSIATWTQPPTITPPISSFNNSFETDFDGWATTSFLRRSGTTPSSSTGPQGAAKGSYYVYAETSLNSNTNFELEKTLPAGEVLFGVTFQYHMYGSMMGSVVLETSATGSSWSQIWSKSGNMGDEWKKAIVFAGNQQKMLRFTYTSLSGTGYYWGDFALDDIKSVAGTPTPAPTFSKPPSPAPTAPRTCYTVRGCDVGTPRHFRSDLKRRPRRFF